MASAAALTLGVVTIPVYEIYKVGDDPTWLEGLDLLGAATGLRAAVVPHYDNAEGGTHDTRFCYMGERRLRTLEALLPDDAFVLGVDSHTALVLDLETGEASIAGLGGVTVRVDGRSTRFGAGSALSIEALGEAARALAAGDATEAVHDAALAGSPAEIRTTAAPPLRDAMADLEGTFVAALEHGETREAVAALLDLDSAIAARLRQGEDSPDLDSASAMFRSLIVRLGDGAAAEWRAAHVIDELVDGLVEARDTARANRDFATADRIRDRLAAAGVEVRDGANGSTWVHADAPDEAWRRQDQRQRATEREMTAEWCATAPPEWAFRVRVRRGTSGTFFPWLDTVPEPTVWGRSSTLLVLPETFRALAPRCRPASRRPRPRRGCNARAAVRAAACQGRGPDGLLHGLRVRGADAPHEPRPACVRQVLAQGRPVPRVARP